MDLFNIRKKCLGEYYDDTFRDFSCKSFIENSRSYIRAFKPYFSLGDEAFSGTREMIYTEEKFKKFLLSWLPEVRYLKNYSEDQGQHIIEKYLKRLVELIPERKGISINRGHGE
ncbi:hypothetical protein [Wolbachia endosymbiont (group E) of Neria commutata]|uniref:hypothetical protein n=1 Tax=Wolbachia endosymbiont (group E) of Neria commutata TaxID=3066149 RepID=UPI0031332349